MSNADWWARKLAAPRQSPNLPPPLPPTPQAWQAPQVPTATPETTSEGIHVWQGGAGVRDASNCPKCGSDLYFSRSNAGGIPTQSGMVAPPPHCYACGFTAGRETPGQPQ